VNGNTKLFESPVEVCHSKFFLVKENDEHIRSVSVDFSTRTEEVSPGGGVLVEVSRSRKRKRDILLGTWNVRSMYRADSLTAAARELARRVVKSIRMRWAGHVERMGEESGVYRVFVGKPEGKRPLGRPRRRWEDNIKMDLQEVGGGRGDWMELTQDRDGWRALVSTVRDFRVP
jgi:hypothetical protein